MKPVLPAPPIPEEYERKLRRKSILFAIIAILGNVFGNLLLTAGMHEIGPMITVSPLAYLHTLKNPMVDGGIVLLAIFLLANLCLLSWADLSYVLPITATGYALAALMGWAALGEHVSPDRWIGVALITIGAILVGRGDPKTV